MPDTPSDPSRPPRFAEGEAPMTVDDLVASRGIDLDPDPDDVAARTRLAIARAEAAAELAADEPASSPAPTPGPKAQTDEAIDEPTDEPAHDAIDEPAEEPTGEPTGAPAADPVVTAGGGFALLGLDPALLGELDELGYEEPTPIQAEAIPPLVASRDLLGQAATGTGKTAAFALPLLHRLANEPKDGSRGKAPLALVLTPTRELAMQVSQAIHRYGRRLRAEVVPVYGGQPIWRQLKALERGVDVVVGTPGRVLDHLERGSLDLSCVEVVVLDEADEMLDMGFQEDIEAILVQGPEYRQTMLFSATMPKRIEKLARTHLHEPVRITIGRAEPAPGESPLIEQRAYVVNRAHKAAALGRVLDMEAPEAAIVFCGTRVEVDELTQVMNGRGYRAEALHGGMTQQQRDKVMERLRGETAELLIATDVAARGLDIDHLTHVVNYDVPSAPESYVHRIGRVGRAGREGTAITLVEPRQHRLLQAIERHTGTKLPVAQVPTVEDLRRRRDDQLRGEVEERLRLAIEDSSELDRQRPVLEALAEEHDLVEVALAALAMAQEALGPDADDDVELPEVRLHTDGGGRKAGAGPGRGGGKGRSGPPAEGMARLWISVGFQGKVRPKDIVGAIANETSVRGKDIGNIDIAPKFTLVDVPADKAREVIDALQNTTIQGRRPKVRPDRA